MKATPSQKEQRAVIHEFVERILDIEQEIGACSIEITGNDFTDQVHVSYHMAFQHYLQRSGQIKSCEKTPGLCGSVMLFDGEEDVAILLGIGGVRENGFIKSQEDGNIHLANSNEEDILYKVKSDRSGRFALHVWFAICPRDEAGHSWYRQKITLAEDSFTCPLCQQKSEWMMLSRDSWHFACVRCSTILSSSARDLYRRAIKKAGAA